jgi:hypothetical protein
VPDLPRSGQEFHLFFLGARLCTFVARLCQNSQRRQTTSGSRSVSGNYYAHPLAEFVASFPNSFKNLHKLPHYHHAVAFGFAELTASSTERTGIPQIRYFTN